MNNQFQAQIHCNDSSTPQVEQKSQYVNDEKLNSDIDEFVKKVSDFFSEEFTNAEAYATGFVERESKLTGHLFLTVFTFGMSHFGTPTYTDLISLLNRIVPELEITRQGFHDRVNEQAVEFFKKMLSLGIKLDVPNRLYELTESVANEFKRVVILDSTSFSLPDELAEYFRGCGGDASKSIIKILFGYDLKSYQFFYLIQNGVDADHLKNSGFLYKISEDDLVIIDLGFWNIKAFAHIDAEKGYYLSRLKPEITLYQKNDAGELEVFDLLEFLKKSTLVQTELEVYLKSDTIIIKTRLIIEKVPDEVKAQRLRRINRTSKKQGRTTRERTKILAGYNLHITNTSKDIIQTKHVRTIYGIRWQIELIFKAWKSNFALDKITGKRPQRIQCMIYAKLLYIFITTKIVGLARSLAWFKSQREVSFFQASKHMKTIALSWLQMIIDNTENSQCLMKDAINFITKHCIKSKSKKREYPFNLLLQLQAQNLDTLA